MIRYPAIGYHPSYYKVEGIFYHFRNRLVFTLLLDTESREMAASFAAERNASTIVSEDSVLYSHSSNQKYINPLLVLPLNIRNPPSCPTISNFPRPKPTNSP